MPDYTRFDAYVAGHADEFLQRLAALCRCASVAAERGPGLADAARLAAETCAWAGVEATLRPIEDGSPVVWGEVGSGPRGLLIYNHYDVQPPDPLDEWHSPPFVPELRDGALYARGSADNKGNLVARLSAVRAYRETIGPLPLRLRFLCEGEEEVGSPHLAPFAAQQAAELRQLDGCIWESGYKDEADRPTLHLGVKGVVAVELHVRTADADAHSAQGGLHPNSAWRLVEALGTLRTPDGAVTVDGLMDHVRPPSEAQVAALEEIPYDAAAIQRSRGMRRFLGNLSGTAALRRLLFEPTCSINGLLSGYTGPGSKTVIPARAMAKLDLRLVPDLTPALVIGLIREHLARRGFDDVDVVDPHDGLMPARTDPGAPIVQTAAQAMADVYGRGPVVWPTAAGSGPMYQVCTLYGLPSVSFGVGWSGSRTHAPNENIRTADFLEGVRVMGRMIGRFGEAAVSDGGTAEVRA